MREISFEVQQLKISSFNFIVYKFIIEYTVLQNKYNPFKLSTIYKNKNNTRKYQCQS